MQWQRIENARLLLPSGWGEGGVDFSDRIRTPGDTADKADSVIDAKGCRLTPGLIDLHTHGIGRFAFERSADDLRDGLKCLPAFGVTTVLPTLYRVLRPDALNQISTLAGVLNEPTNVRVPGFHLEGPFLALAGAGGLTMAGDVGFLDELLSAAGRVSAMSVSPEVPGVIAVIERLVARGIAVFITHTMATVEQTQAAIDAGARHATHFYDVFPVPPVTEPGVRPAGAVETILADPRVTIDFICDGVHVHPAAVRMALASKGDAGVVAITDANVGAGLPTGEYDTPWGYRVSVSPNNAARVADRSHPHYGTLAGSSLTMDRAVANLTEWRFGDTTPWQMVSRNAAAVIGLSDRGTISPGTHADLVLWDDDGRPLKTWVAGECVFDRTTQPTGKTEMSSHE